MMNFYAQVIKGLGIVLLVALSTLTASTQVVYTEPAFPQQTDNVTVFFDASQGNAALAGFSGPVYAHTGVITDESNSGTDWKHVQGNWGTADPNVLMTALGNDLYSIEYNITDYYGVNPGEIVEQLAFVFRNANGSIVGRDADGSDIFTPVYAAGSDLLTTILSPDASSLIVENGSTIEVKAASSVTAELSLFDNGNLLTQVNGTELDFTINVSGTGSHLVEFVADNGSTTSSQSFQYVVPLDQSPQDPPAGTELGINYVIDTEVVLVLYAPNKNNVFVLGDFNDWTLDANFQMRKSLDGNSFWLSIGDLIPDQKYAFQYLVDGTIKVADPYTAEVLDPFNDPFIPSVTYPDLPAYPEEASGIVSVLHPGASPYNWQVNDFEAPAEEDLVIYELLLRDFLSRHDYQTLIDTLDYLDRLGINAIELMPINEFEGNISWGYNPSFHMALDKYYGPINEFKRFIDEAHARGMAVILDVVFNHAFSQNPLAQLYWDANNFKPAPDNPWLNPDARHPFNVGYDFNHESQATKDYVEKIIRYWLSEFKVDGYRFDLSKGFTQFNSNGNVGLWSQYDASRIAILKSYVDVMWEENPNAYAIMEHFAANNEETELADYGMMLWGNMNHEYNEATMGYGNNLNGADYKSRGWAEPKLIAYMESHDEERLMYKNINFGNSSGA
ncbi:MAG: alpha-amylase family glycosyl hydrolase, partial [Bacteroidota bacterium]